MNTSRSNSIFDMKFVQIPNINTAWDKVKINTLSPSTFSWICNGCAYQVLLQKNLYATCDKACTLPPHRNTILGTIVHEIYELTLKKRLTTPKEMMNMWEFLIEKKMKILSETYPTLRNPQINDYDKRNKAIMNAIALLNRKGIHTTSVSDNIKVRSEMKLDCEEIGLYGIADKIIIDSGYVDIIDYKSGQIIDVDGNIKKEYIVQLHLYAAMCKHLAIGGIRSLKLIDINGNIYTIEYDSEFSCRLLKKVNEKIEVLNRALSTRCFQNLIKKDKDRCSNCMCRHICDYMIQSDDAIYRTISGYVENILSSNMYILKNEDIRYYISGIDFYQIDDPEYYIGKKMVFLNLIRSSQISDNFTYKVTENTLIYELL